MAGTRDVNSAPNPAHAPHMAKKGPYTRTGLYKRKLATSEPIQSHNPGRYYVSENNPASLSGKAN